MRTLDLTAVAEGWPLETADKNLRGSSKRPSLTDAVESSSLFLILWGEGMKPGNEGVVVYFTPLTRTKTSTLVIFQKHAFCQYPLWDKKLYNFRGFEVSK